MNPLEELAIKAACRVTNDDGNNMIHYKSGFIEGFNLAKKLALDVYDQCGACGGCCEDKMQAIGDCIDYKSTP